MINKAIILAAGKGLGFNGHDVPAPLVELGGIPLIKRCINALEHNGIYDVVVVVGYRGEEIKRWVASDPGISASITWVETADGDRGVGHSLAAAGPLVDQPALVLNTQVVFGPDILTPLADQEELQHDVTLLVDRKLSRIYDLGAATKVRIQGDEVVELGLDLSAAYDAVALGICVVSPRFLRSLMITDNVDQSFNALAAREVSQHRVGSLDINGSQWQEISSPESRLHAEWLLRAYGEDLSGHPEPPKATKSATVGDPQRTLSYIEGLLSEKNARHYILFNPGPVLTSPRVKSALVHHDVCHRDSDYSVVLRRLQHKLRKVCKVGAEHDIVLLSGSGTASMEAAMSTCIAPSGKLLVISNGAFGERFVEIAQVHDIQTTHLRYDWGQLVDPADVRQALTDDPGIEAVVMCHHETSVGILNPVREVGSICRQHSALFFVDAVSSLGGENVDVRRDQIDVLISSANKCLHAISGVSFVCVAGHVWDRIADHKPRAYYLDLRRYKRISDSNSQTPFTPAVSNFFALDAALDELLQEGVHARIRRYRTTNRRIRQALLRLGMQPFTATGHESHSIVTIGVPPYIAFSELYEQMKRRGYIIYGCKEQLKDRFFQIANMGDLSEEMVQGFLDTLEQVLKRAAKRHDDQRALQALA